MIAQITRVLLGTAAGERVAGLCAEMAWALVGLRASPIRLGS
jgi:hypothetical protein